MIKIVKYKNNKKMLILLIEELQDYLIQIDPLKRLRRLPEYGEAYVDNLLKKIEKNEGVIYIAEFEKNIVGMIAGIIEKEIVGDELGNILSKTARVLELIVSEEFRGKKIGSLLMEELEKHFQQNKCDLVRVEVFEPNKNTHSFYKKCGYTDRVIDMVKSL